MRFFALSPTSKKLVQSFSFKPSWVVLPVGAEGPSATSTRGQHRLAQLQACKTKEGNIFYSVCNLSDDSSSQHQV